LNLKTLVYSLQSQEGGIKETGIELILSGDKGGGGGGQIGIY